MVESDTNSSYTSTDGEIVVRSTQDDTRLSVKRAALQKSEVFDGMFTVCGPAAPPVLELDESGAHLELLLRLLNGPPPPPTSFGQEEASQHSSKFPKKLYNPDTIIPFPMLQLMYGLADKYIIDTEKALGPHLRAHCAEDAVRVYALALRAGEDDIAAEASQFLRPIASYSSDEIAALPDARSVYRLVVLQDQRRRALTHLVLTEDIFPHGYGTCGAHQDQTLERWDNRRKRLSASVDADTDVAWEMDSEGSIGCAACDLAWSRAVAMLAYKSRKAISRIDQLKQD
ncbi:hypothetical protein EV715DRAFT_271644 [Schizophyllum commune]